MVPPVVDRARIERLRPPPSELRVALSMNTFGIFVIVFTAIGLYMRYCNLKSRKSDIYDTLRL